MALMSYLIRDRLGTYYFRRAIPSELQVFMPLPWTGKANWKLSLKTKDPATAKRIASKRLSDCMADFEMAERAKRGELPLADQSPTVQLLPEDIEQQVEAALLSEDDSSRADGDPRKQHQTPEERAQWPDLIPIAFDRKGMEEDHYHAYGEELEMFAADYRKALAKADPKIVDAECRLFLQGRGLALDRASDEYRKVGLAVLRAHVRAYDSMLRRHQGEIIATPSSTGTSKGPKLSEAYKSWKTGSTARGGRKPSERTLLEAEHAVRRLTEWCGDVRLGDLSRMTAREFRDALAKVPKRLTGGLRRLPIKDLLKRDLGAYPAVHAATVNKTLNILAAIVSHAEAAGKLDAVAGFRNPFGKGIKLVIDARSEEGRQPFSVADLSRIFGTAIYLSGDRPSAGGGEAAFWLPLIALLSGARLGELAQLRIQDLAQDDETGVWHFKISTTGERTIKTASSRRLVPLHPELIRIGLLQYRQSLLLVGASSASALWPLVAADREGRRGGPWSRWFNRHLRLKTVIEDRTKVFHSFRHTFKRLARDAHLSEEIHDALTGHAGGGVGRRYGGGFGLKALAKAIEGLQVPVVLSSILWKDPR